MKKIYLYSILSVLALMGPQRLLSQITVTPSVTAATLMNKLLGPGVIGLSPVLTCPSVANGTFTAVTSPTIFDSGIILCSGRAQTGPAPFAGTGAAGPASGFASVDNLGPGDPMLTTLSGSTTHNACVLEFDFRPTGDTVKFDYVFGSEEYNGFTCSGFNDAFGFFISGPGYGSPMNIALVPGTTIPVCINSINCGGGLGGPISTCNAMGPGAPFCAYYIDNIGGPIISYDGITKKLTAVATVTPCDTYHLKLGVADCIDGIYDSGVFLKAGSLTSNTLSISPVGMHPGDTVAGSQFCVRGCLPGKFVFTRGGSLVNPLTIHYLIGGTAVNGLDYSTIADSVVIAASDSDEVVYIHGLTGASSGTKTVKLFILAPYTCGGVPTIIDSAVINILDSFYVNIQTSDTAICEGQFVNLRATGDTVLDYSWSPAGTLSSTTALNPVATPTTTMTYTLTGVYPGAGCAPSKDVVTIQVYKLPVLDVGPAKQITCQGVPLQLNCIVNPPGVPYTYSWSPSTYLNNAAIPNPIFTPLDSVDRVQSVTVSAPVPGCSTTGSFFLHVLPNDFALYSPDTAVCYPPENYLVRGLGDTEFTYRWSPALGVADPNVLETSIFPPASMQYTITASYPHCPDMVHTIAYSIQHPGVDILTADTIVCLKTPMPLDVVVTPPDSPYTFTWTPVSNLVDNGTTITPYFFSSKPGTYTYEVEVKSGLGCMERDTIRITIAPPVQIAITPPSTTIQYGSQIQLNCIRLSPDDLFYAWAPTDGSLSNNNISNPVAKPLETTTYTVIGINEWGCRDTADVTISVDREVTEFIPSAFTPNGDGLNDYFRIGGLNHQRIVDFKVYNRWGQLVYDYRTGSAQGWDGTLKGVPQDLGVYNYVVILAKPGEPEKIYKGNVTLIR